MSKVTIEKMLPTDAKEVVSLGLSTPELHLQNEEPIYYQEEDIKNLTQSPNDIALIAKVDGKFAGYRIATFNPYLRECYLIDTVVKKEYRGMGVATALYKETFKILNEKNCKWAWVLVKKGNTRMEDILKKKGFEKGTLFTVFYKVAPF